MGKASYSIEFKQPVEDVFKFLDDSDLAKQWIGGLESIEPLTAGGNRVGAKAKHIYVEDGRKIEMIEETLIYEPNKRVKIKGAADGFELTVDYRLQAIPMGTRLDYEVETQMKSLLMKILSPLINWSNRKRVSEDFARLKTLVESSS
jgi:carbon monoxide dehydrogenase subunit G